MHKCPNCNSKIKKGTTVCPNCQTNCVPSKPQKSKIANLISFLHPPAGLLFFLGWENKNPEKAKSAGKSAIIGKLISILLTIILPFTAILAIALILKHLGSA